MAANRSGRSESQLTFTRVSPAATRAGGTGASSMPLVVRDRSANPRSDSRADEPVEAPSHQRLATGQPDRVDPQRPGDSGDPDDLVERQYGGPGRKVMPRSGMQ